MRKEYFYCPAQDFSCPYIRHDGTCSLPDPQSECDDAWIDEEDE